MNIIEKLNILVITGLENMQQSIMIFSYEIKKKKKK